MLLLRGTSGLLFLVFGALFALVLVAPEKIEQRARRFVIEQVRLAADRRMPGVVDRVEQLRSIQGKLEAQAQHEQAFVDGDQPERIAALIAAFCHPDCANKREQVRKKKARELRDNARGAIDRLNQGAERLNEWIVGHYVRVLHELIRDLRIFLGTSAALFLVAFALTLLRPVPRVLVAPVFLLLVATCTSAWLYVFSQNWFYTLLFNTYLGWGYLVWVGVVFALLADVGLNRGRVLSALPNLFAAPTC